MRNPIITKMFSVFFIGQDNVTDKMLFEEIHKMNTQHYIDEKMRDGSTHNTLEGEKVSISKLKKKTSGEWG